MVSQLSKLKILFVEDEEIIREHINTSLNYLAGEVQSAINGKEALHLMNEFSPHIIITDLKMDKMNGVDFIKKVREKNKNIPIIVLTAHSSREYLLELVEMNIQHFIIKPIGLEKLISVLKEASKSIKNEEVVEIDLSSLYKYNKKNKTLLFDEEEIRLTKKELLFLEVLVNNFKRVVLYDEIEQHVWADSVMTSAALRSLVRSFRKKLPITLFENFSCLGYKIIMD